MAYKTSKTTTPPPRSKIIPLFAFLLLALISLPIHFALAQSTLATREGPFNIYATDGGDLTPRDYFYDDLQGILNIMSTKPMTVENVDPQTPTNNCIMIGDSAFTQYDTVKLTLNNVNIEAGRGHAAIEIEDDAKFNVNIFLADDSINKLVGGLMTTSFGFAGLQKNVSSSITDTVGKLTIGVPNNSKGNGRLIALGNKGAAGIGNMANGSSPGGTRNIEITGGNVSSTGGPGGAGIGGGLDGSASDITISGGTVEAIGGSRSQASDPEKPGAGIGSGGGYRSSSGGDATRIKVTGGVVTATGGKDSANPAAPAPAIGAASGGTASDNSIDGDAVVIATSGGEGTDALAGFDGGMNRGIVFTRQGEDTDEWESKMYGTNVTVTEDVTFPSDLTVGEDQKLIVEEGVTLSVVDGAELNVEGDIEIKGEVEGDVEIEGAGEITVLVTYDPCGGEVSPTSETKTYKDSEGTKTYGPLPTPTKGQDRFLGWFTEAKEGSQVNSDTPILSESAHTLYAHWKLSPPPTPTPEPNPDFPDTWIPTTDGGWYYEDGNGNPIKDKWEVIDDKTYKFDSEGYALQSEWYFENGAWYYFAPDCAMEEGSWTWIDGRWYAFNWDGSMCSGWIWDNDYRAWYYAFSNGAVAYGDWVWIDGAWYGFNWDCTLCHGWIWDSSYNTWFYCNPSSGAMYTSCWAWIDGAWYGFWQTGGLCYGWIYDGAWYYCDWNSGYMYTNCWIGDTWWWADNSGVCTYMK